MKVEITLTRQRKDPRREKMQKGKGVVDKQTLPLPLPPPAPFFFFSLLLKSIPVWET